MISIAFIIFGKENRQAYDARRHRKYFGFIASSYGFGLSFIKESF